MVHKECSFLCFDKMRIACEPKMNLKMIDSFRAGEYTKGVSKFLVKFWKHVNTKEIINATQKSFPFQSQFLT